MIIAQNRTVIRHSALLPLQVPGAKEAQVMPQRDGFRVQPAELLARQ